MLLLLLLILIPSLLTLVLSNLYFILSKKNIYEREKNSPFECGFDPMCKARFPFSLQFFFIAIIFLIFDIEIALLLPSIITLNKSNLLSWSLTLLFFIMILLIGLYYEWYEGALQWNL